MTAPLPVEANPSKSADFPEGIYALVRLLARQAAREEIATRCTAPRWEA